MCTRPEWETVKKEEDLEEGLLIYSDDVIEIEKIVRHYTTESMKYTAYNYLVILVFLGMLLGFQVHLQYNQCRTLRFIAQIDENFNESQIEYRDWIMTRGLTQT